MSNRTQVIKFNGEVVTQESIDLAIAHYIELYRGAIEEVESGKVYINPCYRDSYINARYADIERLKRGEWDMSFAFLQTAYWLQTGKSVALLP